MVTTKNFSRQINRQNPQLESNIDSFCVKKTVLLLHRLMSDLEMRFTGEQLTACCWFHIIPYGLFTTQNTRRKEFLIFSNFYSEDLPSINCLDSQIDLW